MKYNCPYAEPSRMFLGRLTCKAEKKDGINYELKENFFTVICPYQKECSCDNKIYNTEQGKKCYLLKKEQEEKNKTLIANGL